MAELIRRDEAEERIYEEFDAFDLRDRILFLGEMGSTSHGTSAEPIDDYDCMGIVLPPARNVLGLTKWEHWVRPPGEDGLDVVLYSLEKYVRLLLKSNPNVMGLLYLPERFILREDSRFSLLRENRDAFVSRQAYFTFVGYARAQMEKMVSAAHRGYMGEKRKELVRRFGMDVKHASHTIRILRMGTEFLRTGEMQVFREDRDELKAIKRGEWTLEEVRAEAERGFQEAKEAYVTSPLPEYPDRERAEALLIALQFGNLFGEMILS